MPQREKKQPLQCTRFYWTLDDIIQLLAFLDHCLEFGLDFESSVAGHLAEATGKVFSNKQIYGKLEREWKVYGRDDVPDVDDLFVKGSSVLNYSLELQDQIRDVARHIEPPQEVRGRALTSRSRTLSMSRQASESSTLSTHATPEFEGFHFDIGQAEHAEVGAGGEDSMSDNLDIAAPPSKRIKEGAPSAPPSTPGPDRPPLATQRQYVDAATQYSLLATSEGTPVADLERQLAERSTQLENAQRQNAEHRDLIFTLSNRLSTVEKQCDQARHSARNTVAHMDNFVMQCNLRQENHSLKDQLAKGQMLQQNLELAQTDSLGPPEKTIRNDFEQINVELVNACSTLDIATPASAGFQGMRVHEGDEMVEPWSRRLAQCSFSQLVASGMENELSEFDLVRALAAVGVCAMAFESDYPGLMAREPPVLDQYRSHILTRVGAQTLFHLDLLAHQSLMAEAYFQTHYIEHTAGLLAENLCGPLSRLMMMTSNIRATGGVRPSEPPSPPRSVDSGPLSEVFIQAFVHALQLKAKLLLSPHKYKLVYFRPGDRFRPDRMVRDADTGDLPNPRTRGKIPFRHSKSETAREVPIKLSLFPALYLVPGETNNFEQSFENDFRRCLIDHQKFITDAVGEAGEGAVLVVKAVVLV